MNFSCKKALLHTDYKSHFFLQWWLQESTLLTDKSYYLYTVPSQACCDAVIPGRDSPVCFLLDLLCWTQTAVGHVLSQPRHNFHNFFQLIHTYSLNTVVRKHTATKHVLKASGYGRDREWARGRGGGGKCEFFLRTPQSGITNNLVWKI